jgi:hypothetical protein
MKAILTNAWHIISEPNNKNSQVALAIAVIVVSASAGLICAFVFGLTSRAEGFANRTTGGLVAVLACIGSFSAGGMLGLLFGSPNWGAVLGSGNASAGTDENEKTKRVNGSSLRPNTSLERIADWLTTMIVGLSLVHLNTIEERSTRLAIWLTRAISGNEQATNGSVGIVIVIAFSFAGFLLVYLWAMRFLPSELRSSYSELEHKIDTVVESNKRLQSLFKTQPIFDVPDYALKDADSILESGGIDSATRADILDRYRQAKTADDEPMGNFGPAEVAGYKLSAKVSEAGVNQFRIEAKLSVPEENTATDVFWLLHNTYRPNVVSKCPIRNGEAPFGTVADEAFWLGAVIPMENGNCIRLAIDLRNVDGATEKFKGSTEEQNSGG